MGLTHELKTVLNGSKRPTQTRAFQNSLRNDVVAVVGVIQDDPLEPWRLHAHDLAAERSQLIVVPGKIPAPDSRAVDHQVINVAQLGQVLDFGTGENPAAERAELGQEGGQQFGRFDRECHKFVAMPILKERCQGQGQGQGQREIHEEILQKDTKFEDPFCSSNQTQG